MFIINFNEDLTSADYTVVAEYEGKKVFDSPKEAQHAMLKLAIKELEERRVNIKYEGPVEIEYFRENVDKIFGNISDHIVDFEEIWIANEFSFKINSLD